MKKKMKKVCAGILCAALALTVMVPTTKVDDIVSVVAEEDHDGEFTYNGRRYQYKNKGNSEIGLVRVLDQCGELGIPSSVNINGSVYKVTTLEDYFGYGQKFSKVYVPNSVTTIGGLVFGLAEMDVLQISNNLEKLEGYFCYEAKVNSVSCNSKKITSIGSCCFYSDNCPEIIVFGEWLVKAGVKKGSDTLYLTKAKLANVKKVCGSAIIFDENVTDLMLSSNIQNYNIILQQSSFWNYCNRYIENVYIDGRKVKCKSADDTCPDIIKDNYTIFEGTPFGINYSYKKAEYLLNDLGIKYYGKNSEKVKGSLEASEEYDIALKLHDYIVNNYVYDKSVKTSFDSVFNCHTITKCQFDAEMYAFLLECAGVEAEVVASQEVEEISSSEKEKLVKENPGKSYPKGNYKYGYDGNHAWDAVKIGGKWYYIDTTTDRANNFYAFFLFSNESIEKGNLFFSLVIIEDEDGNTKAYNNRNHIFPHFESYELYGYEDWVNEWRMASHPFQNEKTMLQVPECKEVNGDINMDYYCYDKYDNDDEVNKYKAFILQDDYLKERIMNSTDGYISASKKEADALNGVGGGKPKYKLVEYDETANRAKLLIDSKGLDINFDGRISTVDLVALMQRSNGTPIIEK